MLGVPFIVRQICRVLQQGSAFQTRPKVGFRHTKEAPRQARSVGDIKDHTHAHVAEYLGLRSGTSLQMLGVCAYLSARVVAPENSNRSPGWQFNARQIFPKVSNRTPLALPDFSGEIF